MATVARLSRDLGAVNSLAEFAPLPAPASPDLAARALTSADATSDPALRGDRARV